VSAAGNPEPSSTRSTSSNERAARQHKKSGFVAVGPQSRGHHRWFPGIGAGHVSGFRREGYAVVATSRSIGAADEDDYLTVRGDIAEAQTARNVVEQALNRFARIDCLRFSP
jgi:hypothetical protein